MRLEWIGLVVLAGCGAKPVSEAPRPSPVAGVDLCLTDVYRDRHGTYAELPDGTFQGVGRTSLTGTVERPAGSRLPPRASDYVAAHVTGDGTVEVVLQQEDDREIGKLALAMPRYPAIDDDGHIIATGSGARCAMGIADVRWWDGDALIVNIDYSIGDLCDDRVPAVCSLLVLPSPKDLPVRDE